jgi:transposase-like protein
VGDGALGFWKALRQAYSSTKEQRCWVHQEVNVTNKLPKSQQAKAREIWMAANRADAIKAFDLFVAVYKVKYPGAAECLEKDRDELLAFYDFPAEHWLHIRTTNPMETGIELGATGDKGVESHGTTEAMGMRPLR